MRSPLLVALVLSLAACGADPRVPTPDGWTFDAPAVDGAGDGAQLADAPTSDTAAAPDVRADVAPMACADGGMVCGGSCVDTTRDEMNCGACGRACGMPAHATSLCTRGACSLACLANFGDCDHDAANGCELDLTANPANCGACLHVCAPPATRCVSGTCIQ